MTTLWQVERLQQILDTMDVPTHRRKDYGWLARNLQVRNSTHMDIREAMPLVNYLREKVNA